MMRGRRRGMLLVTGVLGWSLGLVAAGHPSPTQPLGYLSAQGDVRVASQAAPSGTAVFAGDVITTGEGSMVSVKLRSGAQATLVENGELTMGWGDATAPMRLKRGRMALRKAGAEASFVEVGNATVVVRGARGYAAICRVAYVGGAARIVAERGQVEVRRKGLSRMVPPGKMLKLAAGVPQAAGQTAGKVSNLIPQGTVQHPAQTAQVNLSMNDAIVWEDTVRTLNTGRVRIGLNDGSFLNVGVRSTMRIVKHEAGSQQTEIEMQLGKLRGQVVKLSKPGASFQVKTQTAVIGVVGTVFVVTASAQNTNVLCVEGKVNVKNIDPKVPGEKTLGPGEQANVPFGQAPTAAVPTSASGVAEELNATNAGEVPGPGLSQLGEMKFPGEVPPTASVPPTAPPVSSVMNLASVTATGGSVVAGGVAAKAASDANQRALNAVTVTADAASEAGDLADAATDAANAASRFYDGVQTYLDSISPGGPGCACLP